MLTLVRTPHLGWRAPLVVGTLALSVMAGCGAAPAATAPTAVPQPSRQVVVNVSGSSQALSLLRAIEPIFEADTPGYQLEISDVTGAASGQGAAIEGVVQEVLDVAAMTRTLKEEEQAQNLEYVEFGQAGLSIFTHPELGVTNLSDEQVNSIFSGEVTSWAGLGGPDMPIVVFHRGEDATTTETLRDGLLGDQPFAPNSQMIDRTSDLVVAVSGTSGSVGYALLPALRMEGATVQSVSLDGLAPSVSGYPMVQPLGISYLASRKADIEPLVSWLRSEKGRATLTDLGIIVPAN